MTPILYQKRDWVLYHGRCAYVKAIDARARLIKLRFEDRRPFTHQWVRPDDVVFDWSKRDR